MRKYSHINKNRKTGVNRSNLRMKKVRKVRTFRFNGKTVVIHLNHNNSICDLEPRIEFNSLQGRQWGLQEVYNILRNAMSYEEKV